jgi:hypothetical protein
MCCARAIVTAKVKIDGHEQVQIRKQRWNNKEIKKSY